MFQDDIVKRLRFSNDFAKKIHFIITEHLRVFKIPNMRKLKARKLMMHEYFHELLLVSEADNKGRIPQDLKVLQEVNDIYADFGSKLQKKVFFTGNDVMKKYPHLEGKQI
jgi:hypothetical protein